MKKKIIIILSLLLPLIIWEISARLINQTEFFPSLPQLLHTLVQLFLSDTFYVSVGATISRGLAGMLLSLVTASMFAWLFARYEMLYELCRPLLIIMRSIPVISFILLALIFLSPGSIPLMIAFLSMFPLLTENLTKGICSLQPGLSIMTTLFHIGKYNTFMQVIYPQLKPFLFSGLTSAAGFGWRAIIMGEVLSQCTFGIGSEMKRAQSFIAVPELMAWTIVAVFISFVFDKGISWLSCRKVKIHYSSINHRKKHSLSPICLYNAGYEYGVSSFSYIFEPGKVYGISAPSGTGKTTLLNMINGILTPVRGKITIDRSCGVASVFQEPQLLSWLTAIENVILPLARYESKKQAIQKAIYILEEMRFDHTQMSSYPAMLSYGQQQRIAIARAMLYNPASVVLMDEPFKGLDDMVRNHIIKYIKSEQKQGEKIIIFTSHNAEELSLLADHIIYLA